MDVDVSIVGDNVLVRLPRPTKLASTLPYGGIRRNVRNIVFHRVSEDFDEGLLETYSAVAESLGLKLDETLIFLTAVPVSEKHVIRRGEEDAVEVFVVSTVGLGSAFTVPPKRRKTRCTPSTINILAVVDRNLSDGALVELVKTVTEAKTCALYDIDLASEWNPAVGTCTDAVAVGSLGEGEEVIYSGALTPVGSLTSRLVYEAVVEGAKAWGYSPNRSMVKRLEERGLKIEEVVEAAEKLLILPDGYPRARALETLRESLLSFLEDVNVSSLIDAGLRLERDFQRGLIPGLKPEEYSSDPVHLMSDEMLGIALALYLNGWKALFELYRYDSTKPGILSKLPPVMDDLIAALIAGATSRLYDRICGGRA